MFFYDYFFLLHTYPFRRIPLFFKKKYKNLGTGCSEMIVLAHVDKLVVEDC
jgi:hypothetical protein